MSDIERNSYCLSSIRSKEYLKLTNYNNITISQKRATQKTLDIFGATYNIE